MTSEREPDSGKPRPPANQRGTDGVDLIRAALDFLRGGLSADGSASRPPTLAWQKENLREWADSLGLLLTASSLPAKVVRGGQEHELFHDEVVDRYFKVTRHGVLSPAIQTADFSISSNKLSP